MARFPEPIPWRLLLTTVEHAAVACLDPIATQRAVTLMLNVPGSIVGQVPSGDIRINRVLDDGFPALECEGAVRFLYAFRRDGSTPPWTPRQATVVLQVEDDADTEHSLSSFTAFTPDKLWDGRPAVINSDASGNLIPQAGYIFTLTPGSTIAQALIADQTASYLARNPSATAAEAACYIDWGEDLGGTSFWGGTIETTGDVDITLQQGSMLGPALRQLIAVGSFDIVLKPIYDPVNRPGYLCEGSIVELAGQDRPGTVFAWDTPPHSLTKLNRLSDSTPGVRVNTAQFYAGQGGSPVTLVTDAASVTAVGEYWVQQFWPGQMIAAAVHNLALLIVQLAKSGKTVYTLDPAAERAPVPLDAYDLGDRVRLYASSRFRKAITDYRVRVNGIPFLLDDNAVENVSQILTSADGGFGA